MVALERVLDFDWCGAASAAGLTVRHGRCEVATLEHHAHTVHAPAARAACTLFLGPCASAVWVCGGHRPVHAYCLGCLLSRQWDLLHTGPVLIKTTNMGRCIHVLQVPLHSYDAWRLMHASCPLWQWCKRFWLMGLCCRT